MPTGERLAGKLAVVTGAGSGIGQATALLFAAEGATVGVLDVSADAASGTVTLIEKQGRDGAQALVADVAAPRRSRRPWTSSSRRTAACTCSTTTPGSAPGAPSRWPTRTNWHRCFDVNVKGTFLCSRAALRHLGDGGAIVNQGSVAALVGIPSFAAYCAAKGAIVALTRSMAVDLAPRRIRVNVICPGTVYTPLMEPMLRARGEGDLDLGLARTLVKYPLGRLGSPEDIANVALFLASDEAAFMTGAVITPDGGMTAQ